VNFSRRSPKYFSRGGPKVAKFDFTHSKLRKQPFFAKNLIGKCQILNSRGGLAPPATPSDALDTNYIVTALQQRMEIQKTKHFVQLIYSTEFSVCFTKKSVHSLSHASFNFFKNR